MRRSCLLTDAAFQWKDGWKGLPEKRGFLRDVQGGACQLFHTVLAPGSNVYHYDHIHIDLTRRASRRIICQPAAVSGEEIASRAFSKDMPAATTASPARSASDRVAYMRAAHCPRTIRKPLKTSRASGSATRASVLIESEPKLWILVLTRFLHANR